MEREYHDLEIVVKVPKLSQYQGEVSGQDYDVWLKKEGKTFFYSHIKPSRLSQVLEVLVFNPPLEVGSVPE